MTRKKFLHRCPKYLGLGDLGLSSIDQENSFVCIFKSVRIYKWSLCWSSQLTLIKFTRGGHTNHRAKFFGYSFLNTQCLRGTTVQNNWWNILLPQGKY